MFDRTYLKSLAATLALFTAAGAMAQVDNPEVEPNNNKAAATPANSGGSGMVAGDTISGTTTGTSTTVAGATSADYFRVRTAAAEPGIYLYRLALASDTFLQTTTIQGRTQTTGTINLATDAVVQTAPAASRTVQWYGFGREEEIYYRVNGTAASTSPYTSTLTRDRIDPVIIDGTLIPGNIRVAPDSATELGIDTDFWVYDSNFTAIPGFGHDDADAAGVTRSLTPGTYYIALSSYNLANDQASPADDTFRTGIVLDFPNAVASSSATVFNSAGMTVSDGVNTYSASGVRGAYEVLFFQFTVAPSQTPTGNGLATPNRVAGDGTGQTLFTVSATPGINPDSTGIAVTGDLSSLGGSGSQMFFDNGTNGDVTANDLVYSYAFTVPNGTLGGNYQLPFTVADAQDRSSSG
ncbi:MAG: choice-of-anchor X domain-containing protein, partial [Phycisphaerales bacterium]